MKFPLFLLLIFLFSCQEEKNKLQTLQINPENTFQAPIILTPGKDTIKLPVVITVGEPKIIPIPTKKGSFYTKKKKDGTEIKIDLLPLVVGLIENPNAPEGIPHLPILLPMMV